jgi:hypothetical protein
MGPYNMEKLLVLSEHIIPTWKCLTMTNTLAYYVTELITAVKRFVSNTLC